MALIERQKKAELAPLRIKLEKNTTTDWCGTRNSWRRAPTTSLHKLSIS